MVRNGAALTDKLMTRDSIEFRAMSTVHLVSTVPTTDGPFNWYRKCTAATPYSREAGIRRRTNLRVHLRV